MTVLISELVHSHYGKPILVIGGGPSALDDLARVDFVPDCILSANQHGFHLPTGFKIFEPDFTVCIDHKRGHTNELMQDFLRPYGKPIIGVCHWCDYRLADWPLSGNSGLTAIAVAVLMGGHPVIAVGMDGFRGDKYFHDKSEPPEHWSQTVFGKQARQHEVMLRGAWIRAMSGPLAEIFDGKKPEHQLAPAFVHRTASLKAVKMRASMDFFWFNANLRAGDEFVMSETERDWAIRHQYATPIDATKETR